MTCQLKSEDKFASSLSHPPPESISVPDVSYDPLPVSIGLSIAEPAILAGSDAS